MLVNLSQVHHLGSGVKLGSSGNGIYFIICTRKIKQRKKDGKLERGQGRQDMFQRRDRRRGKMNIDAIVKDKGSRSHDFYHICHLPRFFRFLCSAVEDFVIDIVKAWTQIKQNNTAVESVILKVSFLSQCLTSVGARTHFFQ